MRTSLNKKIARIAKMLGHSEEPGKPTILNDVKLDDFEYKMTSLIESYVYFNQDRNIVKATETLSEIMIQLLITARISGVEKVLSQVTSLVCEDIINEPEEGGHRIPLVTQGNHTIINVDTQQKETCSLLIDKVISKAMGYEEEDDLIF